MGPLEGLIVVDASWGAPGSITTMLFADNGADVIKAERPGLATDTLRRFAWERGKRSIELDVREQKGRELLFGLLEKADVFVDSFSPAQGAKIGLDYGSLKARFPRLVQCSITGYGFEGPWRDEPGYDCLLAAKLGLMVEQASVGREGPIFLGHPHIAYGTGFTAAIATLAALRARRETGRGQLVDVSMLDGVLAQSPMNHWWHPQNISYVEMSEGKRVGFGRKRLITAAFECADGEYIQIHTGGQGGFKAVMEIFGFGDITQTPTGSDMALPLNDEEYTIAREYIPEAFKLKPRAEWIKLFEERDIATLPVLRQGEVLDDEQVVFAKRVMTVEHPTLGTLRQAAPPLTLEKAPLTLPTPAPRPGEHSAQVEAFVRSTAKPLTSFGAGRKISHALDGIRVLDFSSFFATAYGAKILSDLGADVIQIEAPGGDQMRPLPNPFEASHRGKRNIVLNLKTAEGRAIAHELVKTADVVMHNQRPGKAEKISLDYKTLSAINPQLVYCYLPGFGSKGPKSQKKSFAPLQSGFTGLLFEGAGQGNIPARSVEGNEDYYNGFLGAVSALVGLEYRAKSGQGQYIESPQLHSSLFVGSHHFLGPNGESLTSLPMDHEQMGWGPLYRLYRTSDGWICIACVGDRCFARLADAMALPAELVERCAAEAGRAEHGAALTDALSARFATMTAADAQSLLRRHRVPNEIPAAKPIVPTLFWEDWAIKTGRVFEHENSLHGHIREVGLYMRLSETPGRRRGPAPRLGQHTGEILKELGYAADRIDELAGKGAIFMDKTR